MLTGTELYEFYVPVILSVNLSFFLGKQAVYCRGSNVWALQEILWATKIWCCVVRLPSSYACFELSTFMSRCFCAHFKTWRGPPAHLSSQSKIKHSHFALQFFDSLDFTAEVWLVSLSSCIIFAPDQDALQVSSSTYLIFWLVVWLCLEIKCIALSGVLLFSLLEMHQLKILWLISHHQVFAKFRLHFFFKRRI